MEEKPKEEINPGSNFLSFPGSGHAREEESRTPHSWFHRTVSPCQLSFPTQQTQPSFPDSCPLQRRSVHFSLLLFLLVLRQSAEAQNRGENGVLLCLGLRAPLSHDCLDARGAKALSANCDRHHCLPRCQHDPGSLLLYSWGEAHPKGSILLFFCQPSQSPNHLFLSKRFGNPK